MADSQSQSQSQLQTQSQPRQHAQPDTPSRQTEHTTPDEDDGSSRASSIAAASDSEDTSPAALDNRDPVTRVTTTTSRAASIVKVPRAQRRGLLSSITIVPEVTNPYDYKRGTKWFVTATVALAAAAAPMGSAIIMPALSLVNSSFGSSPTVTNLSVALYMLSMSIFPLWWSSFSEVVGRRTIYLISFALFMLFGILSAVAQNIAMLIVMRCLSGGAAASVQAVGAGTIADIWEVKERGGAMGIFYLGPLCGPLLAPIIGGALAQGLGWRSTQWFLAIYGLVVWVGILFLLPETLRQKRDVIQEAEIEAETEVEKNIREKENMGTEPATESKASQREGDINSTNPRPATLRRISTRQSVQLKTKKYIKVFHQWFIDPLSILLYLRAIPIALLVYYASITFGSLYVLNISIESTFSKAPYNFSTLIVGLLYIPNSVGYVLASIFGGRWIDRIMHREARRAGRYDDKGKLQFLPEDRMRENAWFAACLFPAALVWYGWTAEKGLHWIIPMIANFFFGVGSMLIFALVTTMLTEFLPRKASAGIALNNFVRNVFSFAGAVSADAIINAIGNGWLFTILGAVSLVSGVCVIWSMNTWGERWRASIKDKLGDAA